MAEDLQPAIRLLLSDLDGTLLQPDHRPSAATIAAIGRLRQAEIAFSVASSRPPRAMREIVEMLGIDVPYAGFNGGTLIGTDGRVLAAHHIDPDAVRTCLQVFAGACVDVWVFADDQWLLRDLNGSYVGHERSALGYDPVPVDSFEPFLPRIDKMVASSADFELLKALEHQLGELLQGQALAARSQDYYLDITAIQANKGQALQSLAAHIGVNIEQTAAIGDGHNDVAMFRVAGLSIAMGQAQEDVRIQADRVTGSNTEEGVVQAIDRYLLPGR
ncbi:Cof-type HAD-IIB family hydrolase [Pseudomonas sp. LJDD11]|uniref:Cof-type HAD-IIB family hydrolase n=1 Tax=unclassified Pseudomonas TaxID=196821 RepID=UPI0004F5FDEF|nr:MULTISPECIES: Cof-type HAD-IIB family hydrolase [unclassified Pseudomonas]MCQ9423074.1 Cof-type HAD-IIB family hydrolase [Pseudomonas sp. LJDD11]BAP45078.1 HAD superfamily hydrolase [Pseudomonas sp. StFLB209]